MRTYAVNVVMQADSLGAASEFAHHFLKFSEWYRQNRSE